MKVISLATNLGRGGISLLVVEAPAADLEEIDLLIDSIRRRGFGLRVGELKYGLIHDRKYNRVIDEVVIAAYSPTCRVISGHGGSASALAIREFFEQLGFKLSLENRFTQDTNKNLDLLKNLLPRTKTETQALKCLEAINNCKHGIAVDIANILEIMRPRIVVLAGSANTGKSSLLNILCGYERVMVSTIAGTTRDAVRDYIDIGGFFTHIIDTAGFRAAAGSSEQEAIDRGSRILETADVILLLLDSSRPLDADTEQALHKATVANKTAVLPVLNKTDLPTQSTFSDLQTTYDLPEPVQISCTEKTGIDILLKRISNFFNT